MFDFINFLEISFVDIADILLVGFLVYYVYKLLKGTVAIGIFLGIVVIFSIWKVTEILKMQLLSGILGQFIGMGFFALIVVFQQEIRKFLLAIGSTKLANPSQFIKGLLFKKNIINPLSQICAEILVSTCQKMGKEKTGALIIFERTQSLDFVKTTGDKMNIEINQPILESIFYKNSPLHDGAIVISAQYIVATRVILPVVCEANLPKQFGLRHRAAASITEKTDATALVVSEETGKISYLKNADFVPYKDFEDLKRILELDLRQSF